jgi:hypothetical protein
MIANVPERAVAQLSQDTAAHHEWQNQLLVVELAFDMPASGSFGCADIGVIEDSLAALAMLPGLEFLDFMAAPALGTSVACDVAEHVASEKHDEA